MPGAAWLQFFAFLIEGYIFDVVEEGTDIIVTEGFSVVVSLVFLGVNALVMFSTSFGRSWIVFKTSLCEPDISISFWPILMRIVNGTVVRTSQC